MDIFLIFQQPLHWLIVTLTNATLNYGLAIVLFTIIIRTILAPLYVIQIRSSRKMMELTPKIKELQKKYGKDREALSRETMALYREHNHNPALGCLLPLIQLPILWSLFLVLRSIASHPPALHHSVYTSSFLWIHDLGKPDQLHLLPIIAGITQWIQQRMMLQPSNDPQQRQMNQIMQFLPLMIVVFAWQYPAGLAVYWVTGNIFMVVMQYFISGWGQLWTTPFSVPYATGGGSTAPSSARAVVPERKQPVRERPAPEPAPRTGTTSAPVNGSADAGVDGNNTDAASGGKMERYQARHGRSAARGRPSAKGAKK
ncbi:MAG TPA: YidC/Oxa1 family membrane protein insertase [Chloroflexota bacterium]|nr:YidC/Oxa1 family membrane protein insertase [Chloroflexota bacterium]